MESWNSKLTEHSSIFAIFISSFKNETKFQKTTVCQMVANILKGVLTCGTRESKYGKIHKLESEVKKIQNIFFPKNHADNFDKE